MIDRWTVPAGRFVIDGQGKNWRRLCDDCREARTRADNEAAKYRMRVRRAEQRTVRDARFKAAGLEIPKRGRPKGS